VFHLCEIGSKYEHYIDLRYYGVQFGRLIPVEGRPTKFLSNKLQDIKHQTTLKFFEVHLDSQIRRDLYIQ
jgi:hypothetical protein